MFIFKSLDKPWWMFEKSSSKNRIESSLKKERAKLNLNLKTKTKEYWARALKTWEWRFSSLLRDGCLNSFFFHSHTNNTKVNVTQTYNQSTRWKQLMIICIWNLHHWIKKRASSKNLSYYFSNMRFCSFVSFLYSELLYMLITQSLKTHSRMCRIYFKLKVHSRVDLRKETNTHKASNQNKWNYNEVPAEKFKNIYVCVFEKGKSYTNMPVIKKISLNV